MDSSGVTTNRKQATADVAFVGSGPAAVVAAIAPARRGVRTTVFERDADPEVAPRFNPDRSYTIDISGTGSVQCDTSTPAATSMTV